MATGTILPPAQSVGLGPGQMGVELKNTDDLDNVFDSGVYYWGGSPPANVPMNGNNKVPYCAMLVIHGGATTKQNVMQSSSEWTRYKFSNNAWTAWVKIVG